MLDHSHPIAANNRNNDTSFITSCCDAMGRIPYFVQCSASNVRRELCGSRDYYWPKDLLVPPSIFQPPAESIICMVDVDMYYNMPEFLSHNDKPVLIATVQPTVCAGTFENYSFTHDHNDVMDYQVSGGGRYKHPWWSYQQDSITAIAKFCGIPYKLKTYAVDRRTVHVHHDVVLLTPTGSWGIWTAVATWLFGSTPLTRAKLFQKTHLRLMVQTPTGLLMSTASPGQHLCATIPKCTDDVLAQLVICSKTALTRPAIESALPKEVPGQIHTNRELTTVLYPYHTQNSGKFFLLEWISNCQTYLSSLIFHLPKPQLTCPNPAVIRSYMFKKFADVAKPTMYAYMQPIIPGCFAPLATKENEEVAVDERITKVKSTAKTTIFISQSINEFIGMLVPVKHCLVPLDHDEVRKRQPRASQQKLLDEADNTLEPVRLIKTFLKAESYPDTKAPRLISTYNPTDKQDYSAYTYSVADWFKECEYIPYAFGKPPSEISEAVAEVCVGANHVIKSDFTKFDGHVSEPCRLLELQLLYRLFPAEYHPKLQDLHNAQYDLLATCTFGTKYDSGFARGSGSPETSIFNSVLNMFATYLAHRMTRVSGSGYYTPFQAWQLVCEGIYGGDDGLSPDLNPEVYVLACKSLGLEVKSEIIRNREIGIQFLARSYGPDVWTGDSSNMCDLPRQLSKIHATTIRPASVTDEQMLIEKMLGYAITDGNTPFLGKFARKVLSFHGDHIIVDREHLSYNVRRVDFTTITEDGLLFHNEPRDWYVEEAERVLPEFKWDDADLWIDSLTSLQDCLKCPGFQEIKPVQEKDTLVIVDDEIKVRVVPPLFEPASTQIPVNLLDKTTRKHNKPMLRAKKYAEQRASWKNFTINRKPNPLPIVKSSVKTSSV
jgi:hypothetical protein